MKMSKIAVIYTAAQVFLQIQFDIVILQLIKNIDQPPGQSSLY